MVAALVVEYAGPAGSPAGRERGVRGSEPKWAWREVWLLWRLWLLVEEEEEEDGTRRRGGERDRDRDREEEDESER
jgi:hypothetical protein